MVQKLVSQVGQSPSNAFVYGVGDFSCITPTPPLTTVPYIGGEDDPAWGPRQTPGDDGLKFH